MPTARRTRRAQEDVVEIATYIGMDNLDAARRFLRAVGEDCNKLAEYPGMGALRGYRRRGLRRVLLAGVRFSELPHILPADE